MPNLASDQDLENDIQNLISLEPRFAYARTCTGALNLRSSAGGYASIIRTIVGQQVSVASANAIWKRLEDAGMTSLENITGTDFDTLRALGLSRQKASYLQALAKAGIDFDGLKNLDNDEIIDILTAVKGIGKWSAEIYLMFALGRRDVFAPGDLALQESAKLLFGLETRPSEAAMRKMAQTWSPYQNASAQLLWAYYHYVKDRAGI